MERVLAKDACAGHSRQAMERAYSIWIVSPQGYLHSRCFEEVALALHEAFGELGYDAPIVTDAARAEGQTIALGVNLLRPGAYIPPNCILYNLEQISADSPWLRMEYVDLLQRYRVWDYSAKNVAALNTAGIGASLCELGYMPGLSRIQRAQDQDIDVVFVGSMNSRRRRILEDLQDHNKKVTGAFNIYGAERDALYARAKLVINIHYYEAKLFEIVRCSYLFANRICVVSESGRDSEIENRYRGGVAFAPYEGLVDACLRLLDDDQARHAIEDRAFKTFSAQSQTGFLRSALAASGLI